MSACKMFTARRHQQGRGQRKLPSAERRGEMAGPGVQGRAPPAPWGPCCSQHCVGASEESFYLCTCFLRRGGVAALAGCESTGSSTRAVEVLVLISLCPAQGGGARAGPAPRGPAGLLTALVLPRPRPSEEQDGADAGRGKKGAVKGGAAAVLRSRQRGRRVRLGPATSALAQPL